MEAIAVSSEVFVLRDDLYIPVVILGSISSFLSLAGSSCLIYMSRRKLDKVMHRLVFGLSVADWFSSAACFIMPFLLPSFLGLPGASGNFASCSAVAFFFHGFILVSAFYNLFLSLYFVLIVVKNWKERPSKISPVEALAHAVAILVSISIMGVAVATDSFNPSPLVSNLCTFSTWPWTCDKDESLECERSSAKTVRALLIARETVTCVVSALSFLGTFLVWYTVRRTFQRSSSYQFASDRSSPGSSDKRLHDVKIQSILYSLAYLNTFFWPTFGIVYAFIRPPQEIIESKDNTGFYILQLFYWALCPLQGFFNFFIYTRLKVKRWRKAEPERSRLSIYVEIVKNNENPPQQRSTTFSSKKPTVVHDNSAVGDENIKSPHEQSEEAGGT